MRRIFWEDNLQVAMERTALFILAICPLFLIGLMGLLPWSVLEFERTLQEIVSFS